MKKRLVLDKQTLRIIAGVMLRDIRGGSPNASEDGNCMTPACFTQHMPCYTDFGPCA